MKKLIEESGLTFKEFSEKFGIPYNTVRQWARDTRKAPQWIKKLFIELYEKKNKSKENEMQPKYMYCFIDETHEIPLRLRRFTNNENVLECEDSFWRKRYKEEWETCDVYKYELTNETKINKKGN